MKCKYALRFYGQNIEDEFIWMMTSHFVNDLHCMKKIKMRVKRDFFSLWGYMAIQKMIVFLKTFQ